MGNLRSFRRKMEKLGCRRGLFFGQSKRGYGGSRTTRGKEKKDGRSGSSLLAGLSGLFVRKGNYVKQGKSRGGG